MVTKVYRVQTSHFVATIWLGTFGVEIRFPALHSERQSHTKKNQNESLSSKSLYPPK